MGKNKDIEFTGSVKRIKILTDNLQLINDSIIEDKIKKITGLEIELLNLKKRISFYRKEFFKGNDFTRQYIEEFKNFIY